MIVRTLIAVLWLACCVSTQAAGKAPQAVIEGAANQVLAILGERREELRADRDALYAVVDSILQPNFDIVYAGRVVLGKHGRNATPEQRRRFIDAFYHSLIRSYADGLLEFTADNLRMLPYKEPEAGANKTRVRTEVILDDGTVVPVDYSLRLNEGAWKVFDVSVEGISYLTNYRKEIGARIRDKGLDGLIADLETRGAAAVEGGASE